MHQNIFVAYVDIGNTGYVDIGRDKIKRPFSVSIDKSSRVLSSKIIFAKDKDFSELSMNEDGNTT
ncbi:hypothetical protein [Azospirillum doebereinerae]